MCTTECLFLYYFLQHNLLRILETLLDMKNQLKQFLPQRHTLCTSLSFRDLSTHLNASTSVVVMSKHLITLSRHPVVHHTIPATNLETVCASELPLPLFNVVSDTKMFYFRQHWMGERGVSRNCGRGCLEWREIFCACLVGVKSDLENLRVNCKVIVCDRVEFMAR